MSPANAMAKLNMQHSDLDSKLTKGLQLKANEQIQTSSINNVEISWTRVKLLMGNLTLDFTSRENALDITNHTRELVGVKEVK